MIAPGVGVNMLDEVKKHNHGTRQNRWQYDREKPDIEPQSRLLIVVQNGSQDAQRDIRSDPDRILKSNPRIKFWFLCLDAVNVISNRNALKVARDEGIRQRNPQIVFVGISPSRRGIARTIDEFVMI